MADFMNTPLDEKTLQALLVPLLLRKFQADQQAQDPMRKAQLEHLQTQTQQMKDANDPSKLIALLSGNADSSGISNNPISRSINPATGNPIFSNQQSNVGAGEQQYFTGAQPGTGYPQKIPVGANAGPSYDPAYDRNSTKPVMLGKNPVTGDWGYNNQGWSGRPDQVSQDTLSPEASKSWLDQMAATQANQPNGGTTQQANTGTTGQANSSAAGIDPKRLVAMAIMSKTMERQGFPSEVRASILEKHFPELAQQKAQANLDKKQSEADIRKAAAPAPGGTYLDENGQQYNPIYGGDIQPKTTLYRANSPQEKIFGATGLLNGHVDATISQLGGIAAGDRNRFAQLLKTKMSVLENNPETNTLVNFLEPATALALGSLYSAGGSRIQGGAKLAQMFKGGVYSPGDTLATTLNNLKAIETLALGTAQHSNMHPALIGEIQQRLDQIDALTKGTSSASKSGTSNAEGWLNAGGVQYKLKSK